MATLLYRLGAFSARHRWAVVAVWLVLLVGLGGAAGALKGTLSNTFSIPGTPALQTLDELEAKIPAAGGASGRIVFAVPEGQTVVEPATAAKIAEVVKEAGAIQGIAAVTDPVTTKSISPDGRVALATVNFTGSATDVPTAAVDALSKVTTAASGSGLEIELGGAAAPQPAGSDTTEAIGVVIALVVLLITFGSIVAAGMTMLTALIGVGVGMSGILLTSGFVEMTSTAPILALMLGLAVGIDYSLFLVSRHRSQLATSMPVRESIARATATAGSAVTFAGLTVVIALAGLSVVGIPFLSVMGLCAAATVAVAVLIALTLVPALLSLAGTKVLPRKARGKAPVAHTATAVAHGRWIRMINKRPAWVIGAVVVLMGVLAVPAMKLDLALPDDGSAPADSTQHKAYDLVADGFGPGLNGPLLLVISGEPAKLTAAAEVLAKDIDALPAGPLAAPGAASSDGTMMTLTVIPKTGPSDDRTEDLVNQIRDLTPQWEAATGTTIGLTGQTAIAVDVSEKLASALPVYLGLVVGLAVILLLLVFRSIVVPIKAALGFLLSIGVAFGATVAVYQWGWLGFLSGDNPQPIISFLPVLMIGVLFGLAMDYQVFMVSGMREAYAKGEDAKQAVMTGFTAGRRVVTAAAIIMFSVFAGFVLSPDTVIASIGFALGVGVLADAFLVRMTLVPAVMTLLGKAGWYLPRWLDKVLPHVDIEGERLMRTLESREKAEVSTTEATEAADALPDRQPEHV
ncbi:MMPL family transporter [Nakamurella sp. YIM 132087]|uniref:MMPL family transporter n=1 Tax=Nakamurella alba TaxID=2665158 RepID=A0A7K1FSB6_9ACTN|nr:MMPL family transporter [Nakamurella alba]MTD17032.1 MMPL family transporter [Nakamurella alba]